MATNTQKTKPITLKGTAFWAHLSKPEKYQGTEIGYSIEVKLESEEANKKLETLTARKMMEMMNVETVFTTDDPVDDLHFKKKHRKDKVELSPEEMKELAKLEKQDHTAGIDDN